jgi:hypothetical protein
MKKVAALSEKRFVSGHGLSHAADYTRNMIGFLRLLCGFS